MITIADFLKKHSEIHPVSFHMPGHKGSRLYREYGYGEFLDDLMNWDVTEIPGADNLFQAESTLKATAERYAALYGVRKSYLLVNGTSSGLIAAVLASVKKGGELIMARNCHKSVFNALTLGDVKPVYAYQKIKESSELPGGITAEEIERLLKAHPDAEAVILPSPDYYGVCSDIKAIAEKVHEKDKILIVDQAHGAHLKFFGKYCKRADLPSAAEDCGADIVVNSIHKTLASFTQSAVLDLCSERPDQDALEDKLQAIQSTSPSYILMASLDISGELIERHGEELFNSWADNLDMFYDAADRIDGLWVQQPGPLMDSTKLDINLGIDGGALEKLLMADNIFPELYTGDILMCMTGIGNRKADYEKLINCLWKAGNNCNIAKSRYTVNSNHYKENITNKERDIYPVPLEKKRVPLEDAEGLICGSSIIPYPPGIPYLCPGEMITSQDMKYIKGLREKGEKVIGLGSDGKVVVGEK